PPEAGGGQQIGGAESPAEERAQRQPEPARLGGGAGPGRRGGVRGPPVVGHRRRHPGEEEASGHGGEEPLPAGPSGAGRHHRGTSGWQKLVNRSLRSISGPAVFPPERARAAMTPAE